jgi:parallel beta-helix repeat protein
MAKQTINNSESGLIVRGKLNDNFTDLYDNLSESAVVGSSGDYTTLADAITASESKIFIKNGTYSISNLEIDYDDCTIIGESKEGVILQVANGQDGLRIYANGCRVENLTIDSETNTGAACLVIGDGQSAGSEDVATGNNNYINNVHLKGTNATFALFVAGPSYSTGSATLTAYNNRNLHSGNVVTNCTGTSTWDGDAFSFSLQKYGKISNNIFKGRIAFYMCMNSECCNNIIYDSVNHGIFIASPSNNNVISNNTIFNSSYSGIKIQNQLEHTPLIAGQGAIGNVISDNNIDSAGNSGFEITGDSSNPILNNTISNNVITNSSNHGIYLQESQKNMINNNMIDTVRTDTGSYSRGSGIYMVSNVTDNHIIGNSILDDGSYTCHCAIGNREDSTCTGNIVSGNHIDCANQERTIWFQSNDTKILGNTIKGGYYAGVRLVGASNCMIANNKIYDNTNQANNSYYEIWIQSSSNNNYIGNNSIGSFTANVAAAGIGIDSGCSGNKIGINYYNGTTADIVDNGTSTESHEESSGIHGVTGDVVGTSDSQTLTNKTIDVDNNTVSNIETDNFKTGVMVTDLDDASANTELAGALAVRYKTDSVEDNLSKKKGYNLLSDEVAGCESTDGWTNSNTTDATDSSNSFVGLNCLKVTLSSTTGSLYRNVLSLLDTSKHYFFSAYVKNGDTSTGIKFGITVTGDTGSAETSRITSTDYTRVGVILQPSGFESASALNIYVDLAGSSSQYAYVDAICIQEITKEEYDGGATALLTKYSYMDSEGISTFAEITSVDDVAVEGRMDGLLIGRSDANLLEDDVAGCESTSGFITNLLTLATDNTEELEGTNCIKGTKTATGNGNFKIDVLSLLDTTKNYLFSGYVKNGDLSTGVSVRVNAVGDGGNKTNTAVSSTSWTRQGVVMSTSEIDGASAVDFYFLFEGANTEIAYIDAIQINEISAEEYSLGADALLDKYPYHRGLAGSGVGRVKSVGKNLFDIERLVTDDSILEVRALNNTQFQITGVSTSGADTFDMMLNITWKKDTQYTFSFRQYETASGYNTKLRIYYTDGTFDDVDSPDPAESTEEFISDANKTISNISYTRSASGGTTIISELQIEEGTLATTYEPHRTSQVYNDRELYSVPSGTHCTKNLNTGVCVSRVKRYVLESGDILSVSNLTNNQRVKVQIPSNFIAESSVSETSGNVIVQNTIGETFYNNRDVSTEQNKFYVLNDELWLLYSLGTYTDLAAAQTALTGTVIHYELDPASYETHYDQPQVLQGFANGTIYNETVIEEMLTYSTGLTITSTDHVIDSLEYVYLVDTTTKAETPIDISDCTIASGGASFTISGASNDEVYRFAYRYNGSGIIAPLTYSYCMTAKDTLDGNTEDINSLHERINLLEKIIRTLV